MLCKNCGTPLNEGEKFCTVCGAAVEETVVTASSPVTYKAPTNEIPEEYSPLSPWAYFGLQILFSIPVVGLVFLIVFSFNGSNINRRNFARSYWCAYIIIAAIVAIAIVLFAIFGISTASLVESAI